MGPPVPGAWVAAFRGAAIGAEGAHPVAEPVAPRGSAPVYCCSDAAGRDAVGAGAASREKRRAEPGSLPGFLLRGLQGIGGDVVGGAGGR